jgi:uncharacterized Ntn-hydrolase superfamily protein
MMARVMARMRRDARSSIPRVSARALAFALALRIAGGAAPARATFSIVARDAASGELGVAVASRVLAVGGVVPHARAAAGAVATQALANLDYGRAGLEALARGDPATAIVKALTDADAERAHRQVGAVDAQGRAAAYTGRECLAWAGQIVGPGYAIQGNLIEGAAVLTGMERAFRESTGPLAGRLLEALAAGEAGGGDRRGRQSAALLVVQAGAGFQGRGDRKVDLRVDDAEDPVAELRRLYSVQDALSDGLYVAAGMELEGREIIGRRAPALDVHDVHAWLDSRPAVATPGHVLLVHLWTAGAESCGPPAPASALADLHQRHAGRGLVVLAIQDPAGSPTSRDATPGEVARRRRWTFPMGQDREGSTVRAWWRTAPGRSMPATILVDRRGVIRFCHSHPTGAAAGGSCADSLVLLDRWIRRLLDERPAR